MEEEGKKERRGEQHLYLYPTSGLGVNPIERARGEEAKLRNNYMRCKASAVSFEGPY